MGVSREFKGPRWAEMLAGTIVAGREEELTVTFTAAFPFTLHYFY